LDHIKGQEFNLTSPTDYEFFAFAMSRCFENLRDIYLAYKVNDLLLTGNNLLLIGDNTREAFYNTYFLRMLATFEPVDKLMQHYEKIVPNTYSPTYGILENVLSSIELHEAYHYLPRIWSDLVLLQYTRREDLIQRLLDVMTKKKPDDPKLMESFVHVVDSLQKVAEADGKNQRATNPLMLSGKMIGEIALIYLYADNIPAAWTIIQSYVDKKNNISGIPSEKSLVGLTEALITLNESDKVMQTLRLMSEFGYPKLDILVARTKESLKLTDQQKNQLEDL